MLAIPALLKNRPDPMPPVHIDRTGGLPARSRAVPAPTLEQATFRGLRGQGDACPAGIIHDTLISASDTRSVADDAAVACPDDGKPIGFHGEVGRHLSILIHPD